MIPPLQSLVKYDNQVLVSTVKDKRIKEKGKANKVKRNFEWSKLRRTRVLAVLRPSLIPPREQR